MRKPGEEFRVYWTEEEGQRYEAEGLVSVIEWDPKPEDEKPRKGTVAASGETLPGGALIARVKRLEDALSDVMKAVNDLSDAMKVIDGLCAESLTPEEVAAVRVALGTAGDAAGQVGAEDIKGSEEPPEVHYQIRALLDAEDEGIDVAKMLEASSKVDDLRAIANDMEIPNLHGKMTKATLVELIVAGLGEQRRRYATRTAWENAQDGAIVRDGVPVVPAGGGS